MRCSLLTGQRTEQHNICDSRNFLLKLGGGGRHPADRLAVTRVVRALTDVASAQSQEPLMRLRVSVTAAAVTGRPAQLQLAVVAGTDCVPLQAEQASSPAVDAMCTQSNGPTAPRMPRCMQRCVGGCMPPGNRMKPAIVHPHCRCCKLRSAATHYGSCRDRRRSRPGTSASASCSTRAGPPAALASQASGCPSIDALPLVRSEPCHGSATATSSQHG